MKNLKTSHIFLVLMPILLLSYSRFSDSASSYEAPARMSQYRSSVQKSTARSSQMPKAENSMFTTRNMMIRVGVLFAVIVVGYCFYRMVGNANPKVRKNGGTKLPQGNENKNRKNSKLGMGTETRDSINGGTPSNKNENEKKESNNEMSELGIQSDQTEILVKFKHPTETEPVGSINIIDMTLVETFSNGLSVKPKCFTIANGEFFYQIDKTSIANSEGKLVNKNKPFVLLRSMGLGSLSKSAVGIALLVSEIDRIGNPEQYSGTSKFRRRSFVRIPERLFTSEMGGIDGFIKKFIEKYTMVGLTIESERSYIDISFADFLGNKAVLAVQKKFSIKRKNRAKKQNV